MSLVNVHNEWDPLEEVIVGSAIGAQIPMLDQGLLVISGLEDGQKLVPGPYNQRIIEEAEEDLEKLVEIFESLKVTVRRPKPVDHSIVFSSPDWRTDGVYNYCPRDIMLAIGNTIIESPMSLRSRYFEINAYKDLLTEYLHSGSKWIAAPKPRLLDEVYNDSNPERLALNELEPIFDAANVIRAGKDILYLVSSSGNKMGALWLQNYLGSEYRVHLCENMYAYTHIDTTITLLREGLVLVNPERVNKQNLPKMFRDWEVLESPPMVDIGYTGVAHGSIWIGMNFLMINPHLAIVCKHQKNLIKLLERHQIDVIPVGIRHARTLGGGAHCVTLDIRRTSAR
jgi:N-dimethylarginine dimethylaminohydrolase